MLDFDEQLKQDMANIFLNGEFSRTAIFKSSTELKEIQVQLFEEPLDKLGETYYHAWCCNGDMPYAEKQDTLQIDGVIYGIVDFSPDEFGHGVNLFIQKV